MQPSVEPARDERRASQRFSVSLAVEADLGPTRLRGHTNDMSEGGACLVLDGAVPPIGAPIRVAFAVPGRADPIEVEAQVRWTAPGPTARCGIMFTRGQRRLLAAVLGGALGAAPTASASAACSVPTFDPESTTVLDMDAGAERPDEQRVLAAFESRYDAFDACVVNAKPKREEPIPGEAEVQILLNPRGATPLGINAALPEPVARDHELRECLRDAVSRADYPSYDGPPVVVVFGFELDPGFDEVPAEE
jgi:hypothetical protein